MATIQLSKVYSSKPGSSAYFTGEIQWSILQKTADGVQVKVVLNTWPSSGYTYATIDGEIYADDELVSNGSWGGESSSYFDDDVDVCENTFWIYYDSSGNASTYLSAKATIRNSGSFSGTITGGKTITETAPAPSVSASTISCASSVQMGKKLLISIDADSADCTHTVSYWFGTARDTIATNAGSSAVWTVPDLADQITNSLYGEGTILCDTYYGGKLIGTTTAFVTLNVPDPTTPSITGGKTTMGTSTIITCRRNSANFTVKMELEFGDSIVSIGSGKMDSCSWTPGYDLAKEIPALTSGTGTLKCTTMNGTAEVGTETSTITVIVPENSITRPAFSASGLVLSPVGSLPEAFKGLYMRGKTGLEARFSASSAYSTIAEYELTVGSQTAKGNPASIDLLVNDGDVKVTGKVTDARGFSTIVSLTIQVMSYKSPRITPYTGYTDVVCERAMDSGELNPNGTYLAIKAGKSYSSVKLNGSEKNSCILHYRWKTNGAPAYSDWITLLEENSRETEISLLIGNVVTSLQNSYLVEIEAADALGGSHSLVFQIMTEAVSFVLYDGPDGAGFGKYPEEPHVVDIASHMTLLVRGKMRVLGDDWVSLGLRAGISESAYEHGRKETGCFYLLTEGRHVHIALGCAFSYAGTALIINEDPVPADYRPERTVFTPCICNDRQLACISVDTDGYIRVEWVQKVTDTVLTGAADVTWVDGYLCYWT